jgi:alanine racemase
MLSVHVGIIRSNYLTIRRRYRGRTLSAVLKSDGYGLGLVPAAKALSEVGCQLFWVNDLDEASRLRNAVPQAEIFTLMGLGGHHMRDFEAVGATPALVSMDEVEHCHGYALLKHRRIPVAIQVDTGLGRLGLGEEEIAALGRRGSMIEALRVRVWVSHLAAYNLPDDPANAEQRARLVRWALRLQTAPISLAASAGIFMSMDWHFDIARAGSAIFGVQTSTRWQTGLSPCYELSAPLLRIAHYPAGRHLGYRGVTVLERPSRIATVAIGYANGLPQRFAEFGTAQLGLAAVPLVGGIAMNMSMIDVTDVPDAVLQAHDRAIFLDRDRPIEPIADRLGCTPNMLLTQIGAGTPRHYVDGSAPR